MSPQKLVLLILLQFNVVQLKLNKKKCLELLIYIYFTTFIKFFHLKDTLFTLVSVSHRQCKHLPFTSINKVCPDTFLTAK